MKQFLLLLTVTTLSATSLYAMEGTQKLSTVFHGHRLALFVSRLQKRGVKKPKKVASQTLEENPPFNFALYCLLAEFNGVQIADAYRKKHGINWSEWRKQSGFQAINTPEGRRWLVIQN